MARSGRFLPGRKLPLSPSGVLTPAPAKGDKHYSNIGSVSVLMHLDHRCAKLGTCPSLSGASHAPTSSAPPTALSPGPSVAVYSRRHRERVPSVGPDSPDKVRTKTWIVLYVTATARRLTDGF